jgi:valyl-tRNA synthetase
VDPAANWVDETPAGEKKILKPFDDPLYKAYNPQIVESSWDLWWEKQGFFEPELDADGNVKKEGLFVIPEPPPNVTGELHIGHAIANSLQDAMIRYNRMKGKTTLWVPGCDHAGIATQAVVEKKLKKEGKTRHDLGREKFVDLVWEWKGDYHKRINTSLRKMGTSYDWTREAFTLDEVRSEAVTECFVRLHDEGIIYRSNRLVNWCVQLNTALSKLEVDDKELSGRTLIDVPGYDEQVEFGVIVHFKYPIEGSDETLEVATTRVETMLGDSGIAVSPTDTRYTHLVGKNAIHPFIPGRKLPIVADDSVEADFGTGAVKITPAHDQTDFDRGKRHNLEFISILNDNGTFNENAGPFAGQKRYDARKTVIEALKKKGLYVETKDNPMKIPVCQRSGDIIEPIVRPQWWMRMRELADEAIKVVKNGEIKIRPEASEKDFYRWMESINDWCISRQLWWGHRTPTYFIKFDGEPRGDSAKGELWVSGRNLEEAEKKAKDRYPDKKYTLEQDEDVLDTWFSSGLWPFSTLGWPNKTDDMAHFYPMSVLETGWDILFFWVARMIMLGVKMTGQVPFREVFCHALIRDSEGRKMSKSLGNVIRPDDVIQGISLQQLHDTLLVGNISDKDIPKAIQYQNTAFPDGIPQCGTDAMRFALCSYTSGGTDINMDIKVVFGYRKFCNKIYQATKFVLGNIGDDFVPEKTGKITGKESLPEKWILHKLSTAAKAINQALEDREFQQATLIVYQYWYNQLCDVYIENSKSIIRDGTPEEKLSAKNTLYTALEGALTLIHPFMPFLTEELWQRLPRRPDDKNPTITKAAYPQYDPEMDDPASESAYELVTDVAGGIRKLTSEYLIKTDGQGMYNKSCGRKCKTNLE